AVLKNIYISVNNKITGKSTARKPIDSKEKQSYQHIYSPYYYYYYPVYTIILCVFLKKRSICFGNGEPV
ncbi:MAG TPA: hypothetical protein PLT66_00650, partial [Bacillota bacterium]|nr:hypothetical protein [Bacillota bacterium]